jgi:MoxR-like ATPase
MADGRPRTADMTPDRTLGEIKERVDSYADRFRALRAEIGRVVVGQDATVNGVLLALMADGHVLLEGVPGLGKTLLVRTIGEATHLAFARIQFTPDLMPADIVGTNVIVDGDTGRHFQFQRGPVFTNVLLADEINRATPKTQSALLEAMQERQVTVGQTTYPLDRPFFVLATQNPLEMEGTYPLPEAQLDRFVFKLHVEFPARADMIEILARTTAGTSASAEPVLTGDDLREMQAITREVVLAPHVAELAVDYVFATHPDNELATDEVRRFVRYGSSPRGAQAITLTAKARALMNGRYNVSASDLEAVLKPALRHRIGLNFEGEAEAVSVDDLLDGVVAAVKARREKALLQR